MARSVATAAINEARDSHYVYNPVTGLYERSLFLEGSSPNLVLQSEDFSAASWGATGSPTRTAAAIPASVMGVSLDLIGDTDAAAVSYFSQTVTFTGDGVKALSIYMKKGLAPPVSGSRFYLIDNVSSITRAQGRVTWDASGVPTVTMDVGTLQETPREIANGIYRIMLQTSALVAANPHGIRVAPATALAETGDVYAGGVQAENNPFCTSYVKTTTATVTRSADSCSFPFTLPPQEMTVYAKFIERGTIASGGGVRLFQIGSAANPRFLVNEAAGKFAAQHLTASATVASSAAVAPAIGDLVEIRAVLYADGSVQLGQTINGSAEAVAARSAANALQPAWSAQTLSLASQSGSGAYGFAAFLSVKVARGTKTLAEMRAL